MELSISKSENLKTKPDDAGLGCLVEHSLTLARIDLRLDWRQHLVDAGIGKAAKITAAKFLLRICRVSQEA